MDARILLVDDDASLLKTTKTLLTMQNMDVTAVSTVAEALREIVMGDYDALVTDLHMPGPGDGLTLASAMRHSQPQAATILVSSFPALEAAAQAIVKQADEVLLKPIKARELAGVIESRIHREDLPGPGAESIVSVLSACAEAIVADWFGLIQNDPGIMAVPLTVEERMGSLPGMILALVERLRSSDPAEGRERTSTPAAQHGAARKRLGYTPAMIAEERRILQRCLHRCLQENLDKLNFGTMLIDLLTIADEMAAQMTESLGAFSDERTRTVSKH